MEHRALRRSLPIAAMAIVMLLALATLGVGYGLWSKTLTISGTVQTGSVDAKWLGGICNEFHTWPDLPRSKDDYGEVEGKDVGDWDLYVDTADDQILHFSITNGYPSYAVDCQVHFEVEGSIPVILRGTTIVPTSANLTNCTLIVGPSGQAKTLKCDQLTVKYTDGIGVQLHPGDEEASSLTVHVEQPADQNATYTFDVLECMAQWNETATAEQCFAAAP